MLRYSSEKYVAVLGRDVRTDKPDQIPNGERKMIAPKVRRGTKMHVHVAAGGIYGDVGAQGGLRRVFREAHNCSLEDGFPGYVIRGRARREYGYVSLLRPTRGRKKDGSRDYGAADDVANFMFHIRSRSAFIHMVPKGPWRASIDLIWAGRRCCFPTNKNRSAAIGIRRV
jgi:hypothetical protein